MLYDTTVLTQLANLHLPWETRTSLNLDLHLSDPGKQGSLNEWIKAIWNNGNKVFLSDDANFLTIIRRRFGPNQWRCFYYVQLWNLTNQKSSWLPFRTTVRDKKKNWKTVPRIAAITSYHKLHSRWQSQLLLIYWAVYGFWPLYVMFEFGKST